MIPPRLTPPVASTGGEISYQCSDPKRIVLLPRGGLYVHTRAGGVQLGMPPETIKDILSAGVELPVLYVTPAMLFDFRRGMNMAEVEFPAYYAFFRYGRRLRVAVQDAAAEARVRVVLGESLLGPALGQHLRSGSQGPASRRGRAPLESHVAPEREHADDFPRAALPDFVREGESFRTLPDGRRLDVDVLVEFVRFDLSQGIDLGQGVVVRRRIADETIVIEEDGVTVATVSEHCSLPDRSASRSSPSEVFHPPDFGVTVLGASHGFDPSGKTTGFLLWLGGRGVLVDPPVDAMEHLRDWGVSEAQLDGVVLTHCHADHDSGTIQKLLAERRINLYTTPTILGSFLRKAAALTGLSEDVLRRTFTFCPVTIGAINRVGAGELAFFYTLHSIPALGLEAFYGGKSLAISGDSLYDPKRIAQLRENGVLSPERAEHLLAFPFHDSLVLHEAGVPPIHTPAAVLAELPDDVKSRMYLVHIAERDVPKESGLRAAPVGLAHTLRIDVDRPHFAPAIEVLEAFASCELFAELPIGRAKEVLALARPVSLPAGSTILRAGERGRELYVVQSGLVQIEHDGRIIRTYGPGDFFGETAILRGSPRNADAVAQSDVELLEFDRHGFSYLVRGTDVWRRLERLARMREEASWEVFSDNSVLRVLSPAQKTQLQSLLEPHECRTGDILWHAGSRASDAYLVVDAKLSLEHSGRDLDPFGRGAFLGEFDAIVAQAPLATSLRVVEGGRLFRIAAVDLERFFSTNPRALVSFLGARFVE